MVFAVVTNSPTLRLMNYAQGSVFYVGGETGGVLTKVDIVRTRDALLGLRVCLATKGKGTHQCQHLYVLSFSSQ